MAEYDVQRYDWEIGSLDSLWQRLCAEATLLNIILPPIELWDAIADKYGFSHLDFQLMLYNMLEHFAEFPSNAYITWDLATSNFIAFGIYPVLHISFSDGFSDDLEPNWKVFCDGFRYNFVSTIRKG